MLPRLLDVPEDLVKGVVAAERDAVPKVYFLKNLFPPGRIPYFFKSISA